ncbi:hypothetical protein DMENIID0001_016420 [Sergentomyia squamirostris]
MNSDLAVATNIILPTSYTANEEEIVMHNYFIIFESSPYELIHTTAIPQHLKEDIFAIQDIEHPLLSIDVSHQRYFPMTKKELEACPNLHEAVFLCQPYIVNNVLDHPSCLINKVFKKPQEDLCSRKIIFHCEPITRPDSGDSNWQAEFEQSSRKWS